MVGKLFYGLKDPNFTEAEIRTLTEKFTLGTLQPIVDRIDELSGTDEHLHGVGDDVPHHLRRHAEQMVMTTAWLKRFPGGRSTRRRGTTRARGAGRPAAKRTTTASRDGPKDDESSEPPPAGRRKLCSFCGRVVQRAPQADYCTDAHAAADRKRRQRERNRERDLRPPAPQPADYWRMRQITYEDLRWLGELVVCRCDGHLEFEPGWCFRSGRRSPRRKPPPYEAFLAAE
jgi:hypothetical protein